MINKEWLDAEKIIDDDNFEYTEITPDIWQVKDDGLSFFTLVRGEKLAVVWDAGYGVRDIRKFVENNVATPYIVILSHAHPDHIMGSFRFKEAYLPEKDRPYVKYYCCSEYREKLIAALDDKIKCNKIICNMLLDADLPLFRNINPGDSIDLGGLHASVINLAGHSKGSIGLLLQEERILLSGDSLNPNLWIFNEGACRLRETLHNLEAAVNLPFDRFIGGHSANAISKDVVYAHINNLKSLKFDAKTYQVRVGCETYKSVYNRNGAYSEIIYDKGLL